MYEGDGRINPYMPVRKSGTYFSWGEVSLAEKAHAEK